jgi:hypothetical protein
MTDSKIQAARKLLEGGTPAREVAHSLGVSAPHVVSLGARLFTDVKDFAKTAGEGRPGDQAHRAFILTPIGQGVQFACHRDPRCEGIDLLPQASDSDPLAKNDLNFPGSTAIA